MDASQGQGEITQWLQLWREGDAAGLDKILPVVYNELRQLAAYELRGNAHNTLQATALLHDVFVRLLGAERINLQNRKHLFATAAKLMRQILVDRSRSQQRDKRGGGQVQHVPLIEALHLPIEADLDIVALDEALNTLAVLDSRMAQIVELRSFVGIEISEIAKLLDIDERTVYRDWAMAKAILRKDIFES